jgi:hypothetical protein
VDTLTEVSNRAEALHKIKERIARLQEQANEHQSGLELAITAKDKALADVVSEML